MNKWKKFRRITGIVFLLVGLTVTSLLVYVKEALPSIPLETIHVQATPTRVARGNYLFHSVANCVSCHSERDGLSFTMPVKEGTEGGGGETFDHKLDFPGSFTAKNLTPYHMGDWTDGELFRAIVSGVSKDGKALFPIMPYEHYGQADKEDIFSIIAYLRTLKPIAATWPVSHADFPMNFIINTIPRKPGFHVIPAVSDSVNYGKYLVNMASCRTCHSQAVKGKVIDALEFAGGREMSLPTGGVIHSANITPDMETGIGSWSRESFIQRFKSYADTSFHPGPVGRNEFNTIMPWSAYGSMTTGDLAAIYAYLRTVKPIRNPVTKFSADHLSADHLSADHQ